ncbi:hypothetical protein ACLOJK_005094 [Asimina triloba]
MLSRLKRKGDRLVGSLTSRRAGLELGPAMPLPSSPTPLYLTPWTGRPQLQTITKRISPDEPGGMMGSA